MSSTFNKWLKKAYKLLAVLLVVFAVLISVLRLFMPYAHHYRNDVESYLNNTYDSNITIGSLAMGWEKFGPTLIVQQIQLIKDENTEIFVDSLEVELDFWRSLRQRKIVTQDFVISGARISINDASMPAVSANAATNSDSERQTSLRESIENVFLERIARFSIQNSHVYYLTNRGERAFSIKQLYWLNDDEQHRATGAISLDGISSNNIKLVADFTGESIHNLGGQIYLEANQINITPWLDKVLVLEDENTHSSINFNAWLSITDGRAVSAQIALGENEMSWQHQEKLETFSISNGHVFIEAKPSNHFQISTTPLSIQRNTQEPQPLTLQAKVFENGIEGFISALSLSSFDGVFPLLSEDDDLELLLKELSLTGEIKDIHFKKLHDDISLFAKFNDINSHYSSGIPGIDNLQGDVVFHRNKINVSLQAIDGKLDFGKHFKAPIPYNSIDTELNIEFGHQGWSLNAKELTLVSEELALTAQANVEELVNAPITMALLVSVRDGDAQYASHYYPHLLMGDDLVDYLNNAIISGKVKQAEVLFNGPLIAFPFHQNEGVFVVDAELSESTFAFDPSWPAIEHFAANLNFTNNGMLITGRSGTLSGIDVSGVEAAIDDLADKQVLTVDAAFNQVSPKDVELLMNNSPMQDSIGATLAQVQVQKAIDGTFSLILPLNNTDDVIAKGHVIFKDNEVALQTPQMIFNKVNGRLNYHNDLITTQGVSIEWRGMPLDLDAHAEQGKDTYTVNIDTLALWESKQWQAQLPDKLREYGDGQLSWQGKLALTIGDDDFAYDYQVNSDLINVSFALPAPFNKDVADKVPLAIHAFGDDKATTIEADIGKKVNFYGLLDHETTHFSLAHLVLGQQQQWLPMAGFHITADLDAAEYAQWQPLVIDILDAVTPAEIAESVNTELPLLSAPTRINGVIKNLNVFEEFLSDLTFDLTPTENWWLLDVNAKEMRASARFYPDWYLQGIDVDADFIHLASQVGIDKELIEPVVTNKGQKTSLAEAPSLINAGLNNEIMANMPRLNVKCTSCKYGVYDFGNVSFLVERENDKTLLLNNFLAKRDKTTLAFNGQWQQVEDKTYTKLKGQLKSKNVEREVEKIGYASIIKDSGVDIDYDIKWLGGPHDFALKHFNGDVTASFDDGYLADVDDKGVRILSILSLQSLVRKLSFDFRDIFSDGMFYRELKGHFTVENGVAYTDNIKMKGTAGDLIIIGNTNLNNGDLDYKISYKPNLTSSLPVLAWIATLNPVTFLAGVALDEVITSTVIAEIKFEVTGNLDDPQVKQVSRKNQNISVGRSSPPKIVDNLPQQPIPNNTASDEEVIKQPKPLKEVKKIDG